MRDLVVAFKLEAGILPAAVSEKRLALVWTKVVMFYPFVGS